ncbi:helix-turn-helix domain-containing protein [Nocardioides bigeumensis]|uniref:TetR/AcrR family transcriptional regulator n=1 Tax=Nocardioides bigeumensis TaxID=433657 RepID=A0ABN2YYU3_9ACTN
MSSLRHTYLDAARACILDVGWRRTTLTEVARRAGVSRMTIYRTWSDMPQLLGDLMTREWGAVVATTLARTEQPGASDDAVTTLARGMVAAVSALRDNELFVRIVELDPELLLPYLLSRRGRSQQALLELLRDQIAAGQTAGAIRAADADAVARSLLLASHGFVFSAQTMVDDDVSLADLDAELSELVERMLRP